MCRNAHSHELDVAYGYWMGQSPVTVAQYQSFIDDGGYNAGQVLE